MNTYRRAKPSSVRVALSAVLAAVVFVSFTLPAYAGKKGEVSTIVAALQNRYRSIKTVSAGFTQEFFASGIAKPVVTAGTVYFKKPGKMRWKYEKGSSDLIVSDGETLWIFQPDLNQVLESHSNVGSTIATDFLSGMGNLQEDFIVKLIEETDKGYLLELSPVKEQQNVRRVLLHVDKSRNMVVKTVVEDFFGNKTHVSFSSIEINPPIKDPFFTFKPPPGVTVVRE